MLILIDQIKMKNSSSHSSQLLFRILALIGVILVFPALLINLGLPVLLSDEPIRAMVSMEMIMTENYLSPTIGGIHYYYKPPLYNWLLAGFFLLFNSYDELIVRLPAIISLLLFAVSIFLYARKNMGFEWAVLLAFFFVTSGDILFWDSMLGLIDLSYSLITFLSLVVIMEYSRKKKYLTLFLLSYFLAAMGFLMKALPSLVFQAAGLLVVFIYNRDVRSLFRWQHFAGIFLFLVLAGGFFIAFSPYGSVENYLRVLFFQSSQRTVAAHGIWRTLEHLVLFPLEFIYHFLPWTILLIFSIHRKTIRLLKSSTWIWTMVLMFLINIVIYWISPEFHPRYILMLLPFVLIIAVFLYGNTQHEKSPLRRYIMVIFSVLVYAFPLLILVVLFYPLHPDMSYRLLKLGFLLFVSAGLVYVWVRHREERVRFMLLVILLLIARIAYNWYVIPVKAEKHPDKLYVEEACDIVKLVGSNDVRIYKRTPVHEITIFYISREQQQILRRQFEQFDASTFYIIDDKGLKGKDYELVRSVHSKWLSDKTLYLVRFRNH